MIFTVGSHKGRIELDAKDGAILFSVIVGEAGIRLTALLDPDDAVDLADRLIDGSRMIKNRQAAAERSE